MFVDYEYYKNDFLGADLTEEEFNKFGNLACKYITNNTLSRVTDESISSYPATLAEDIKNCACRLSEFLKDVDFARSSVIYGMKSGEGGLIKSKSAGAVSISFDIDNLSKLYLDRKNVENEKKTILNDYLSPRRIGGILYNRPVRKSHRAQIVEKCIT